MTKIKEKIRFCVHFRSVQMSHKVTAFSYSITLKPLLYDHSTRCSTNFRFRDLTLIIIGIVRTTNNLMIQVFFLLDPTPRESFTLNTSEYESEPRRTYLFVGKAVVLTSRRNHRQNPWRSSWSGSWSTLLSVTLPNQGISLPIKIYSKGFLFVLWEGEIKGTSYCRASSNRNGQKNRKIGIRTPKK